MVANSKFVSKSLLCKKLKESSSSSSSSAKSEKPSSKGTTPSKMLSKFIKRLSFRRSSKTHPDAAGNCTKQDHGKNKFSGGDHSSVPAARNTETPVCKKFQEARRKESLNSSPNLSRNQRFDDGFLYAGGEVRQRTCNGMYLGILVIVILSGLLQGRISAMLCVFSCSLLFNAVEMPSRRAVVVMNRYH